MDGFLAASVGDDDLIELHRKNNRAWRERIERLVGAGAPDWPAERVVTVAFALVGATEERPNSPASTPTPTTPHPKRPCSIHAGAYGLPVLQAPTAGRESGSERIGLLDRSRARASSSRPAATAAPMRTARSVTSLIDVIHWPV